MARRNNCRLRWPAVNRGLAVLPGLVLIAASTVASTMVNAGDDLLEVGRGAKLIGPPAATKETTVVSYNIRWRTGDDLKQIGDWLKKKQASIIALQEIDRARERTQRTNNARVLADQLGMYYAWTAPPPVSVTDEEETGVELLSSYPLSDVKRIVLPDKGPGGRSRVALGATIRIGKTSLRVYSVHAENRMPEAQKVAQLQAVLDDLARFPKTTPAIVMGDFNSWEPAMVDRVRELFTRGGWETPFKDEQTFQRKIVVFNLNLKLDWIWLRGLSSRSYGVDRSITVSDHFPLWTTVDSSRFSEVASEARP